MVGDGMRKKFCPQCGRVSFSASREAWICPYCQEDISIQPDYNINDKTQQGGEIRAEETQDKVENLIT